MKNNDKEKTIVVTRKFTLYPLDETKENVNKIYKFVEDTMEVQARVLNKTISALYTARMNGVSSEEETEIRHLHSRMPFGNKESAFESIFYDDSPENLNKLKETIEVPKKLITQAKKDGKTDEEIEKIIDKHKMNEIKNKIYKNKLPKSAIPKGYTIIGDAPHVAGDILSKAYKDGLAYGSVSVPSFKKTMPFGVSKNNLQPIEKGVKHLGIHHDYDSPGELTEAILTEDEPKLWIDLPQGMSLKFVLGNTYKSSNLRHTLCHIFDGSYEVCNSSIQLDKKTKRKIQLNLALKIPVAVNTLDENITCGVKLGLHVPAVVALNNNPYIRQSIGSFDDFVAQRTKIAAEKRRIHKQLRNTKGGHGRKKKLAHLEKINLHEREFAKTYNHMVSKRVVEFALKNHAKYINLEELSDIKNETNKFVFRNWSYFELQTMIQNKAAKEGIEVNFINPAGTVVTCSVCGEIMDSIDDDRTFKCSNPDCKCKEIYTPNGSNKMYFDKDFNAARNIAMSTAFTAHGKNEKKKAAKAVAS